MIIGIVSYLKLTKWKLPVVLTRGGSINSNKSRWDGGPQRNFMVLLCPRFKSARCLISYLNQYDLVVWSPDLCLKSKKALQQLSTTAQKNNNITTNQLNARTTDDKLSTTAMNPIRNIESIKEKALTFATFELEWDIELSRPLCSDGRRHLDSEVMAWA